MPRRNASAGQRPTRASREKIGLESLSLSDAEGKACRPLIASPLALAAIIKAEYGARLAECEARRGTGFIDG